MLNKKLLLLFLLFEVRLYIFILKEVNIINVDCYIFSDKE